MTRNSARRKAAGATLVVFVGTGFANLMLLIATAVAARQLGPSEFGAIGAMLALILIISVLPFALSVLIARDVASARSDDEALLRTRARIVHRIAAGTALIGAVTSPLLATTLGVPTALVLITMLSAYPQVLLAIPRGLLQGRQRFYSFALNLTWEGLCRLFAVLVALALGGGVIAVGAAPLVAMGTSLALGLIQTGRARSLLRLIRVRFRGWGKELIGAIALYGGVFAMTNTDVVIAKARFADPVAGDYAVAAMFGKIVFFLPIAIGAVMVPLVSSAKAGGKPTGRILGGAVTAVIALSLAATLVALVAPGTIRNILGGPAYAGADEIIALYGLAMTMLALAALLGSYLIAVGATRVAPLFLASAAVEVGVLAVVPPRPVTFVIVVISIATFLAVSCLVFAGAILRRDRPATTA